MKIKTEVLSSLAITYWYIHELSWNCLQTIYHLI